MYAYFEQNSKIWKSSTLDAHFSMIKAMLNVENNQDIAVIIRCADQRAQLDPTVAKVSMYLRMNKVKRKKIYIDEETSHLREQGR
ncbi:hypothetical protein NQ317_002766 [Molorchus minor]|uniref:Uncharacterized protein n=1 Tax=Molorchus minor TaxID=1323400 RepID=A0ABQ9IYJ2_9CUCU|nr:hypothetical protein NQ317_002766 [Molorchus minor]